MILIAIVALVVGVVGYAAMLPAEYRVERATTIAAPPAKVFEHIADFRKWERWSPWAKLDPNAKVTFAGAESGPGAVMKWSGNDQVGEGQMAIVDAKTAERVGIKLDFTRPYPSSADVEFLLRAKGEGTEVTWALAGRNDLMGRIVCLFMNMDRMIGSDYEKGLASLKGVVEGAR